MDADERADAELKEVPTDKLRLDPENPRFLHLELRGSVNLAQEDLEDEIREEEATLDLARSVRKEGVLNPITVAPDGDVFRVIDGNRRTVVLKMLHEDDDIQPPEGVTYDRVKAHVLPEGTEGVDIEVLKGVIQSGARPWGRYNDAAYVQRLRKKYMMAFEDIADALQMSVGEVKERLKHYAEFHDYVQTTEDTDEHRFSYFAEMPNRVRKWVEASDDNRKRYYTLICPKSDDHKIRSVATKGGLRDFNKVLKDDEATEKFLEDPDTSVDDALRIAEANLLLMGAPVLKRLSTEAKQLRALRPDQIEKLKEEPTMKMDLKDLKDACEEVLDKLG